MRIDPHEPWREAPEPAPRQREAGPHGSAAHRPAQAEDDDELSLSKLVQTLWAGKWVILAATLAATGYAAWDVSRETPLYSATSQVVLKTAQEQVIDLQGVGPKLSLDFTGINTEARVLKSRELMARVVDAMALHEDPEFNPSLAPPQAPGGGGPIGRALATLGLGAAPPGPPLPPDDARNAAIGRLHGKVEVNHVTLSYVFEIRAVTTEPAKSAAIANKVAELYVEGQREAKYQAMEDAMAWLSERVVELKQEVEAAEGEVERFVAGARLVNAESLTADTLRLKSMRDHQAEQVATAGQLRARADRLAALRAEGDFAALAQAIEDPGIRRIARDLADGSPDPGELAVFDVALDALAAGLRANAERAGHRAGEIGKAIADLTAQVDAQSADLIALQQLRREAEATRLIYESFLNRLKELSVQQGIQQADSRVLSWAGVPGAPSHPDKGSSITKGAFAGLALGVVLVFLVNALRNTIRTPEELEALTGLTVIGAIPDDPVREPRALIELVASKPASRLAEAVRNLRMAIQLSNVDRTPKLVAITSSVPDEGKSILAAVLAATTAMSGKRVLLVDADLRRRVLSAYLGAGTERGIVSVITGSATLAEAVHRDERSGLDLLIAENSKVTPVDFFESRHFAEFVEAARAEYDLVVFDTPPVLAVPDARILAQYADALVYAVKWNSTTRRMIVSGLGLLRQVNVAVTGLALTRIDPKRMNLYGYYGYGYRRDKLQKYYS